MPNALTKSGPIGKPYRVVGRLRHACDLMVWGDQTSKPLPWNDAARAVGISARSMRKSLERPAVRAYLMQQKQVFRTCLSAKTLWRLDELASQDENRNAAVAALRVIEGQDEAQSRSLHSNSPHVTIRIVGPAVAPAPVTIEHSPPVIEYGDDPNDPTKRLREPMFRWPRDEDR